MATATNRPPGPRGKPLVGVALELRKHGLDLLARCAREYGDIVYLPLHFGESRLLVSHPDFIEQVLVMQQHKFHKSAMSKAATGRLLGNGLLNSEGDFWRRQRRLAQPAFQKTRVNEYATTMAEHALAYTASWRDGEVRDLADEMSDSLVYRIIEERRSRGGDGNDLLSRLIAAMDEDGTQMTPRQLRDETMTLFLAGHETTALTLSWTWYLLAQNPAAEARLHEELSRVLAARRPPEAKDAESLPYLDAVIRESLRLYPPAYLIARAAVEPFDLGGYSFPAGTTVLMSQWVMHRDPRYFPEPLAFRPERWLDGLSARLPAHAYFPFGGGPRRCIGQGFAMMEAAIVAGTLAQRFRFELEPGQKIVPEPLVTLRPRGGIHMRIRAWGPGIREKSGVSKKGLN